MESSNFEKFFVELRRGVKFIVVDVIGGFFKFLFGGEEPIGDKPVAPLPGNPLAISDIPGVVKYDEVRLPYKVE